MPFMFATNFEFAQVLVSVRKLNAAVLLKSKMEGSLAGFDWRQSELIFQRAHVTE